MTADDEEPARRVHTPGGSVQRILRIVTLVPVIFLVFVNGFTPLVELPIRLVLGWIFHLRHTVHPVEASSLMLPLGSLAVALMLLHRFIRWWRDALKKPEPWRRRHTLAISALLLSGAASAIFLSAVAHQAMWLATGPSLLHSDRNPSEIEARVKMSQTLAALVAFHERHGRHATSLAELDFSPEHHWVSPHRDAPPEPIVYFMPDRTESAEARILLCSPELSPGRMLIGLSSGRVEFTRSTPPALEEMLRPNPEPHE